MVQIVNIINAEVNGWDEADIDSRKVYIQEINEKLT